jgi:nitroreductase
VSEDILTTIRERRSVRRYTGEAVSKEEIRKVLEAGRWAPSGLNNQPCRFLVIRDDDPRKERLEECTRYAHVVREAQVLIGVFLDREAMYHPMKDHQGAGACIQNMLLAVHALGLGGVWLGEIVNQADQVMDVLGASGERYELMAVIAVGRPAQAGSSSRKELSELLLEELGD